MACFWRSGMPLATDKKNYPEWFDVVIQSTIAVQFKCIIQKSQSFTQQNNKEIQARVSQQVRKHTDTILTLSGAKH